MSSPRSETAVRLPVPALRPFIARYAGFCVQGLPPGTHAGLPSGHVHLIFGLGRQVDIIRMPSATQKPGAFTAFVSGLQDAPATMRHDGNLHVLHVFLTPLGVRAILGISSPELVSRVIDFSDVWGRKAGDLLERLMAAGTWEQRFNLLDAVFVRALRPTAAPRRELAWAWDRLVRAHGCMPMRQLAQELGWSRRPFSEQFRTELGVPPKTAARIFRFERACRLIKDERPSDAELAFASGYHDQAHMTREWNALAGCTPRIWIARELPFVQDYELSGRDDERVHA